VGGVTIFTPPEIRIPVGGQGFNVCVAMAQKAKRLALGDQPV
jgi:hypothetical protein